MKKPSGTNHEASNQHTQRADYKTKPQKHRQPSNREKSALMGFYAAAKRQGGSHD